MIFFARNIAGAASCTSVREAAGTSRMQVQHLTHCDGQVRAPTGLAAPQRDDRRPGRSPALLQATTVSPITDGRAKRSTYHSAAAAFSTLRLSHPVMLDMKTRAYGCAASMVVQASQPGGSKRKRLCPNSLLTCLMTRLLPVSSMACRTRPLYWRRPVAAFAPPTRPLPICWAIRKTCLSV